MLNKSSEYVVAADVANIPDCIRFIEDELSALGTNRRQTLRSLLVSEDMLAELISRVHANDNLTIRVSKFFSDVSITISCKGERLVLQETNMGIDELKNSDLGDEADAVVRGIVMRTLGTEQFVRYIKGSNIVRIKVEKSKYKNLYYTFGAMVLGVIFGLIIKSLLPHNITDIVVGNVFDLISTMILAVYLLSVGAPGVPGGALVCVSLLLPQIGVPAEALSLLIGLYSLVSTIQTSTNVTGDAAVTLIVAKSENMVDEQVYYG